MRFILSLVASFLATTAFADGKPVSLFNGKDFTGWDGDTEKTVGSSRVDLQACKLEYSIVSPK